jgi:hypothetical protein
VNNEVTAASFAKALEPNLTDGLNPDVPNVVVGAAVEEVPDLLPLAPPTVALLQ